MLIFSSSRAGRTANDASAWVRGKLQRNRERITVRGLNDNHHDLKNLFKGAAISASARPGPLQDFYLARVAQGMRPTMAGLTLARKIATITLTMWKKGATSTHNNCTGKQFEHRVGCGLGLLGAVAATRLLRSFLSGVSPFDPGVLACSTLAMLLLAWQLLHYQPHAFRV